MSGNDAKASPEVGEKIENIGDKLSPNITSAADEAQEVDKEAEERRKRETVDIDGVPIDEKDIEFHSSKINKKDTKELFVNVEGAEKRAREAEHKKHLEERRRIEEQRAEERKERAEERAEEKKIAEAERAERREQRQQKREDFAFKVHENRKTIRIWAIIGVIVLAAVIAAGVFAVRALITKNKVAEHEEYNNKTSQSVLDSDSANELFQNGDYKGGMDAYDKLIKNAPNEESKAVLYLQRAIAISDYFQGDTELDQAISDAYEAEKIHPNSLSAETIAGLERRKGNEEAAARYDQLAAERLGEDLDPQQGEG